LSAQCNAIRAQLKHNPEGKGEDEMIGSPQIEERGEQPYVGIRTQISMQELGPTIQQSIGELFAWLERQGAEPAGPPLIRYYVIDMAAKLDVEVGIPVAVALAGDQRVSASVLPAGRYASLIYTDISRGIEGNAALLDWGTARGLVWDRWNDANGDAFGARYESFLTDPADEPNPTKWETEVAIRLADV
jgi:effector-binding domain-containing protein